ncbi:MAG: 50S ribosomal protein L23 [Deltaproteobacteria bacterium]|nr:50S ribosomal protein L23 [Deltaproteobacteria bacterium]
MKELHHILKKPLITEKSNIMKEMANQVVFVVAPKATKIEIRKAVEEVFKVKVVGVRTARMTGKRKRFGRTMRRRPDWKKAVVALAPGERIDFFEGA